MDHPVIVTVPCFSGAPWELDQLRPLAGYPLRAMRLPGLEALVLSGGFAANPVTSPLVKAKISAARFLPGELYRHLTLRFHARSLASPHDSQGEIPWTVKDSRRLFVENTPWASYVARAKAAFSADYRDRLRRIEVPTLVLTPSYDRLIGEEAARTMVERIPDAHEVVLEGTGHMFRFSHPLTYAAAVLRFVDARVNQRRPPVTTEEVTA